MHSSQCFVSTHSEGSESLLFILDLQQEIFFLHLDVQTRIQPFSFQSLYEGALEFETFTTATRKLQS